MGNLFSPPRTAPYTPVGQNSNAYNLLGGWADAATKNGWDKEDVDKVIEEATSGDLREPATCPRHPLHTRVAP